MSTLTARRRALAEATSAAERRPPAGPAPAPVPAPAVRIHRPARSVTQSGHGRSREWVIEFEPQSAPRIDPLTGWTGSGDTLQHVRLRFPDRARAVAFAERQGWIYTVDEPQERRVRPRNYADSLRHLYARAPAERRRA